MDKTKITRGIFLVILGAVAVFIVFSILKRPDSSAAPLTITLQPRVVASPTPPPVTSIEVYVTGAIDKPDVYKLPIGSIVKDLISSAGGATSDADLESINLAQRLNDQDHIHVPHKGEAVPTPNSGSGAGGLININTADAKALDTLPGIGPATAQGIIDYRTNNGLFKKIEDIKNVPRIGDALFEKIKDMITVGP